MAAYAWKQVTGQAAFAPRDGAGALSFGGRMWFIGGWNPSDKGHFPSTCTNDVWSSSDGAAWRLEKPNTFGTPAFDGAVDWEGRHTAGYAVHEGRMWIVGGDPIQGHYQGDVWASEDGRTWDCICRQAPWAPRALHYTVAHDGRLWVMGGQTTPQFAPAATTFYNDVWCSANGADWERVEVSEPRWPARGMIGASAVHGGRMWLLGGGRYDTPDVPERVFYNDVWSSGDGAHWTLHSAAAPWHPRQYHEVAVFDGRLWVLEGWNGGNRNDVWHSPDGVHWAELRGTPWAPRHAASVFVHGGCLWVVAGNNMESDVWRLNPTT